MRIPVLLTTFVVITLAVLAGGYFALPSIASIALAHVLSSAGFDGASATVEHVGLTKAEIVNLDLGRNTSLNADRIVIDYSPARLASGLIDGVTLEAPELGLKVDTSGVSMGALDVFIKSSDTTDLSGAGPKISIIGPVVVKAGRLLISTPVGTVAASVDGEVLLTDGLGTQLQSAFSLDHEKAQLSGRLNGVIDDSDQVRLDIEIEKARSDAQLAFSELVGAVTIEGTLSSAFDGGGSMTMQDVSYDGLPIGNVDLAGALDGTSAHLELLLAGDGTGLTLQTKVDMPHIFDLSAPVRVAGEIATDGLRGAFALPSGIGVIGAASFLVEASQGDIRGLPAYFASGRPFRNNGVSGIVDADLLSIEIPSQRISATLDGATSFLIDNRSMQARPVDALAVDLTVATDDSDYTLRSSIAPIENIPFVALGPAGQQPVDVGMTLDGHLDGFGKLAGALGGNLWVGDKEGIAFENFSVQLQPWRTRIAGLELSVARLVTQLSGPIDSLLIGLSGDVLFSGTPSKGTSIRGGGATFATRLEFEPKSIALYADGCPEFRLSSLTSAAIKIQPGPMVLCPTSDKTPLLRLVKDNGSIKRVDAAGALSSVELQAEGIGPYPIAGLLPRIETTASYSLKDGTWWTRLSGKGGDVSLEGPDIAFVGANMTAELEGKSSVLGARLKIGSAKLADKRRPLRFQPVTVSGNTALTSDAIDFDVRAEIIDGPVFDARGRHRESEGRGNVTLRLPRWYAKPGNTIVSEAFPILRGIVTDVTGGVEGEARWDWTPRGIRSKARLSIENGAFASLPVEVQGINGTINLVDVMTPKSDGVQRFAVGLVDAGFPLKDGTIEFELPGDNTARIDIASWPFAGGRISANRVVIPFDAMPAQITATIDDLDATQLVNLADVADLYAEGALNGSVPLRFTDQGVVIDNARLSSMGRGTLRYRSASAAESLKQSGGSAEILARALEDFRFDELDIRLDGPLDGEILAKAQINGSNPGLYDGKRIELNVSLQGALREFLQSANVIRNIPETIRDRVQGPSGNQ